MTATSAEACKALRGSLGASSAPDDLGRLAKAAGIMAIRIAELPIDGMLTPTSDGFVVTIGSHVPETRRRYTLAHEIAHAVLGGQSTQACFRTDRTQVAAERAADAFAAEVVLPEEQVRHWAVGHAPTMSSVRSLSSEFRTSLEAAFIRVGELGLWDAIAIKFMWLSRPDAAEKLRVTYAASLPSARMYVPRWAPAPAALRDLWRTGEGALSARINFDLGSLRGRYPCDAIRRSDDLLALVILQSGAPGA